MDKTIQEISFNNIKTRKRDKTNTDDSCQELKNIEYKTLLINGNNITSQLRDVSNNSIDIMLDRETKLNKSLLWNKVDKTNKIKIFTKYVEHLAIKHILNNEEKDKILKYLIDCIDKKLLLKYRDVNYDKNSGELIDIPNLCFNELTREFSLRKSDKHVSSLRSLAPIKNKTVKNL